MSGKTTGKVWKLELSMPEKYILLAFADRADANDENSNPGYEVVAKMTGYTARHVRRIADKLIGKGILEIMDAPIGKPISFKICIDPKVDTLDIAIADVTPDIATTPDIAMSPRTHDVLPTPDIASLKMSGNGKNVKDRDKKNISVASENKSKSPRDPNPMYDAVHAIWGYAAALNGEMQKMLQGVSKRPGFKEFNLDTPISAEDLRRWAMWYRKTELHDDLGLNMVADRMKVQSSITAWQDKQARRRADDAVRAEAERIWNAQHAEVQAS